MDADVERLQKYFADVLRFGQVPRLADVKAWVRENRLKIPPKKIKAVYDLQDETMMNRPQQRQKLRGGKWRPIVVNNLGHWHCDIGFFSVNKKYATPPTYRAGFLVAKDVLSRYIYATPLLKNRKADSIIKAFKILFQQHKEKFPGVPVLSISFDQETSVVGTKVQTFLKDLGISFRAFQMSDSKAKQAENAIRQIRATMAVLLRRNRPKDRWWNLLPTVVESLNSRPIIVDNKNLRLSPTEISLKNVRVFKQRLFKSVPAYYWAQYPLSVEWSTWKYDIGTVVRAKKIAVSSATIGNKTSEVSVTQETFVIEAKVPYVTRNMRYGKAYRCRNLNTDIREVFQEDEIVAGRSSSSSSSSREEVEPMDTSEDEEYDENDVVEI